jgi:hypothetical protein
MYVASRSLLNLCDHKITIITSESTRIPSTFPTAPDQTVYCHPTALKQFVENYLPKVEFPFILVSGDSDMTIPLDCKEEADIILSSYYITAWYAQNCIHNSNKLRQLPIGLDFHTLLHKNHPWGPQQTLEQQEACLIRIRRSATQRLPICYSNFHLNLKGRYSYDRKIAITTIPSSLIFYEPKHLPREETWKNMVNYTYVISPHGNGLDCHRTWEALALGCIPIVRTSPLDPMFEGLPVIIVKEWSCITKELLDSYQPVGNLDKITLSYWKNILIKHK